MDFQTYFQSYKNYFWQWEENTEVITIPGGSTIAYRDFVLDILEKLVPQGLPPFGSLLMAILATNPTGLTSIDALFRILNFSGREELSNDLKQAVAFLKILAGLPQKYKEQNGRLLLLQAIFEGCHHILSLDNSRNIYEGYRKYGGNQNIQTASNDLHLTIRRDLRSIAILKHRFATGDDIIRKIASLPGVPEELSIHRPTEKATGEKIDFVQQLEENPKTFYVGALIRRIWSGLNIPVHSAVPALQPLGGVADLSNKGDLHHLLISEFANDDLVFLSRLANNEALYIQREIPPFHDNLQRIILIDASIRNWGTPKAIAFAVMIAIAKHPKNEISCRSYAIGKSYVPIDISGVNTVIEGLQVLDGCLHAAEGLAAFFKAFQPDKKVEVILISSHIAIQHPEMLKVLNNHRPHISYNVFTDAQGGVDIFKKQQAAYKHIQHVKLPLQDLWKKHKKTVVQPEVYDEQAAHPVLCRNAGDIKHILSAGGNTFIITQRQVLLRFFDRFSTAAQKGWEVMNTKLPLAGGECEIGMLKGGVLLLLMFNPQDKHITLMNLSNQSSKRFLFGEWKSSNGNSFVFYQESFYHVNNQGCWKIEPSGIVSKNASFEREKLKARNKELQALKSSRFIDHSSILRNVNHVFINEVNNLVINNHELLLKAESHIKLERAAFTVKTVEANRVKGGRFEFPDGSALEIGRAGIFVLKSSDEQIPDIYFPSVLDASLGCRAGHVFAGNELYLSEEQFHIDLVSPGPTALNLIKVFKDFAEIGLSDAKNLIDSAPCRLVSYCSRAKTDHLKTLLESNGAVLNIIPVNEGKAEVNKISPPAFFRNYIEHFVNRIISYGT